MLLKITAAFLLWYLVASSVSPSLSLHKHISHQSLQSDRLTFIDQIYVTTFTWPDLWLNYFVFVFLFTESTEKRKLSLLFCWLTPHWSNCHCLTTYLYPHWPLAARLYTPIICPTTLPGLRSHYPCVSFKQSPKLWHTHSFPVHSEWSLAEHDGR